MIVQLRLKLARGEREMCGRKEGDQGLRFTDKITL